MTALFSIAKGPLLSRGRAVEPERGEGGAEEQADLR
ncbi:hypothetical protein SBI_05620 [Streptomyces bingchenggensis BCW-1]|uniref:Uncharacterized protein n=1 Tax=Streptomyces bingchenggensis (strain BCW-1) TaxID=749414 RepID=D7CCK9_STRBB|nr:hypothetical protein SBI_05620 [Streptomyces bingchenggensis BCW-1]